MAKSDIHVELSSRNSDMTDTPIGYGSRISDAANGIGGKRALAVTAGISESQLYRIIAEGSFPTIDTIQKIAKATGVTVEWLVTGRKDGKVDADVVLIPRYDISASTGRASLADKANIIAHHHYRKDYLRERGLHADQCAVLDVVGDAMAPTLNNGDIILVDLRADQRRTDGVYVISLEKELLIKRIQILPAGKMRIISDNKAYDSFDINTRDPATGFEFVGRIDTKSGPVL